MANRKRQSHSILPTDADVSAKSEYFPKSRLDPRSPERILDYDQEPLPVNPSPVECTPRLAALSNGSSGGILLTCLILAYLGRRNGGGR